MIEIEIKAEVKDIEKVKDNLKKADARFIKTEEQVDRIFGHSMFLDENKFITEGGLSARIRQVNDKKQIDFKEITRDKAGIEVSAEIGSVEDGLRFLKKLGFEEAFTLKKSRDVFQYNDFTICLDKVDKLGNFIEIEKLVYSNSEEEKIRQGCMELLNKLAPGSQVERRKYGDLIQELLNKDK
ncbi:class IV adenylate cyclase [Candidatus Woesearchaeota archaeon CG_4_10_14_0_2_um_filter_33_10]|nr:MAG: hypothetical protein AUJ83_03745 [Candidatus Woesearchaeota archaeon CG1_02_33_12]PIN77644.1 MAG: class IV adenylate cyclase [Candidatus Woesearchaeota archaeon CG10_big_fil_rev_8_21_14_0_10_33_12]PIU72819.1 MAG: class IV adenylate cyclase [Candidatus Woesearchaeota archaeon CG06_land_8_20_14_3_00_33_13]PIZ53964.1 MAG: class IV adenylate cyclase [Candidatus Woesearchaeota archaeon CG_4_10_14_0_2_um_filter_33_10]